MTLVTPVHCPTGRRGALRRVSTTRVLVGGLALIGAFAVPSLAVGQSRAGATRIELETMRDLVRSGSLKMNSRELMEIERRLSLGDFSIGDQISLQVIGESSFTATFSVAPGPSISLPDIPTISLAGVLRSELNDHLTEELSVYVRNLEVHATSLMRIAMFGAVGAPGFYHLSPNLTLSDAIMSAGGPAPTADMRKIVIRRGDQQIFDKKQVTQAITAGTTLDRMNLRGGDALDVGTAGSSLIGTVGRVILTAGGLAIAIIAVQNLLN